ncbi:fibroblast growth factor receptor 4-like [Pecten maximus]|uniref:fibroblast growth factor receptor 4-like n=1 Tax=Pecten maximus TaxID=6579 RepID=UPI001457E6AA|nr:fibroblast growth factor receptor 4-like [Pecten maximus]
MKPENIDIVVFILMNFINFLPVATLQPRGPPKMVDMPTTDLEYKEGETMRISCLMTSKPRPILYWYRHGRQMWHHHDPRYNISRTVLIISSLNLNDSGEYSCRGINQYGLKEVIFTLNVLSDNKEEKDLQQLTIVPSNLTATLGQSIKLVCSLILDQDAPEYVSWVKRDSLDQFISNDTIIQTSVSYTNESPQLYLPNLSYDDEGLYTCIIINEGVEHCHTWLWISPESVHQSTESQAVNENRLVVVYVIVPLVAVVAIAVIGILIYRKWKATRLSHQGITYFTVEKTSDSTRDLVT